MKKFICALISCCLLLSMCAVPAFASDDYYVVDLLNTDSTFDDPYISYMDPAAPLYAGMEVEDGYISLVPQENPNTEQGTTYHDQFIAFDFANTSDIDVSEYKYIALRYKTNMDSGEKLRAKLRMGTNSKGAEYWNFPIAIAVELNTNGEWNTAVFEWTACDTDGTNVGVDCFIPGTVFLMGPPNLADEALTEWYAKVFEGSPDRFRLDFFKADAPAQDLEQSMNHLDAHEDGDYIYLESVAFCKDAATAAAYTGIYNTQDTTPAPTTPSTEENPKSGDSTIGFVALSAVAFVVLTVSLKKRNFEA